MEGLVSVINGLQDTAAVLGLSDSLSFPSIAVVGSQSSGKSSVLESIVGEQFLPRGKDIVTRTPIILHFVNNRDPEAVPYIKFADRPEIYTDFSLVEKEIRRLTDELAGTDGVSVSDKPIILSITSPNVPTLSLTDLPGLIQVEEHGAVGRKAAIEGMVAKHVSGDHVIMLAVADAQIDIANAVGVSFARELDARGNRTLGILTKIDLAAQIPERIDQLKQLFDNRLVRLRYPWIGVVNLQDSHQGSDQARAADERAVFDRNPELRKYKEKNGVAYLAAQLEKLFHEHVMLQVPTLQTRISEVIADLQRQLDALPMGTDGANEGLLTSLAINLIQQYANSIAESVRGRPDSTSVRAIADSFHEDFFETVDQESKAWLDIPDADITTVVHRAKGKNDGLAVPHDAFVALLRPILTRLGQPARIVAERAYMDFLQFCIEKAGIFTAHSGLRMLVVREIRSVLEESRTKVVTFVDTLLATEIAHLNFRHVDFLAPRPEAFHTIWVDAIVHDTEVRTPAGGAILPGGATDDAGRPVPAPADSAATGEAEEPSAPPKAQATSRFSCDELESIQASVIRRNVEKYFKIVYWKYGDLVAKGVAAFLIEGTKQRLASRLYTAVRESNLKDLMRENPDVAARREALTTKLEGLRAMQDSLLQYQTARVMPARPVEMDAPMRPVDSGSSSARPASRPTTPVAGRVHAKEAPPLVDE